MTSHSDWVSVNYSEDNQLPLEGEIIVLQYSMRLTKRFQFDPTSQPPSTHPSFTGPQQLSNSPTPSIYDPVLDLPTPHHVLITNVVHDQENRSITLSFLPIFSYQKPPRRFRGSNWSPTEWISQAPYVTRLHHLPISAQGWTPSDSPSPQTPRLSFGEWLNDRPSWVITHHVEHRITEDYKWLRHPTPIILDGGTDGILELYSYLGRIHYLASKPPPGSNVEVYTAMIPDVGVDIFRGCLGCGDSIISNDVKKPVMGNGQIAAEELEELLKGNDGMDPISFWTIPGAPKVMREWAKAQEKAMFDEDILKWRSEIESDELDHPVVKDHETGSAGTDSEYADDDDANTSPENLTEKS